MTQISISYAITVHNEHEELKRLLNQLFSVLGENDEIVIQADQGKVTDEVISVLFPHKRDKRFVYIEYPLNKDFSAFKNNLFKYCTKDYIFNIDADEYLSNELLTGVKSLLNTYNDIEAFRLPRINTVSGITPEYVRLMGWNVNEFGWVNWPDPQMRIVKNTENIHWVGKVHERLEGFKNYVNMPFEIDGKPYSEWALIHPKTFERQKVQNDLYNTI